MASPIQLDRLTRRCWRLAAVAVALLGVVAVIAVASAVRMSMDDGHHHGGGHSKNAVVLCFVLGGCVLAVATAAVAVHRLVQRGAWLIRAPLTPVLRCVPSPRRFPARAGPPPLLQVFRL